MPRSKWLEGKIRALRNNARREAIRNGEATVGDGTVVNHEGAGFVNVTTLKGAQKAAKGPKGIQSAEASAADGGYAKAKKAKKSGGTA